MGEPAELGDEDRQRAEWIAGEIVDGVSDEVGPVMVVGRCAEHYDLDVDFVVLIIAMRLRELAAKVRDFSAQYTWRHAPMVEAGIADETEDMKRAREARQLYGKPSKAVRVRMDRGEFERVGGEALCDVCGVAYVDHDPVVGFPWLRHGCDGRLLKP